MKNLNQVLKFFVALAFMQATAYAIPVYDNLSFSPERGVFTDGQSAQGFSLGNNNIVESVVVQLFSIGNPTGPVHFEVWDSDTNSIPGNVVGRLGSVDAENVGGGLAFYTFDNPVTGLTPNDLYFIVANYVDADITFTGGTPTMPAMSENVVDWTTREAPDGTTGGIEFLFRGSLQSDWTNVSGFTGNESNNYALMRVEANLVPVPSTLLLFVFAIVGLSIRKNINVAQP